MEAGVDIINEQQPISRMNDSEGQAKQAPDPFTHTSQGDPVFDPPELHEALAGRGNVRPDEVLRDAADPIRSIVGSMILTASVTMSSSGVSTISPKSAATSSGVSADDDIHWRGDPFRGTALEARLIAAVETNPLD